MSDLTPAEFDAYCANHDLAINGDGDFGYQLHQLNLSDDAVTGFNDSDDSFAEFQIQLAYSSDPDNLVDISLVGDADGIQVFALASDGTKIKIPFIPKEHWVPLPPEAKQVLLQHQ